MLSVQETCSLIQSVASGEKPENAGPALLSILSHLYDRKDDLSLSEAHAFTAQNYQAFLTNALQQAGKLKGYNCEEIEDIAFSIMHDFKPAAEWNTTNTGQQHLAETIVNETIRAVDSLHRKRLFPDVGAFLLVMTRYAHTPENLKIGVEFINRSTRRILSEFENVEDHSLYNFAYHFGQTAKSLLSFRRNNPENDYPAAMTIDRFLLKAEENFESLLLAMISKDHVHYAMLVAGAFKNDPPVTNPLQAKATEVFELIAKNYGHKLTSDLSRYEKPYDKPSDWQAAFSKTLRGNVSSVIPSL